MFNTARKPQPIAHPDLPALLRSKQPQTLAKITSVLRHPRSLARPNPTWRPPTLSIPFPSGDGLDQVNLTITRRRVGPNAQARIKGFGEQRRPAYVISLRFSHPEATVAPPEVAEAWIRALMGVDVDCVHVLEDEYAPTFLWMVDAQYQPLHSPASLFANFAQAA
ncbi:hypothetical protein [Corynebacterium gerontici]|uniref:Uncharacterized protein n=1 Tax=Corynebacterium gerontici TaxID=2079234 RepID=A0A3G6IZH6_9CORY|nr:hypothetical protein [Corynebacterium gerontici]AZA11185.1 hypothetical protein CGERO_04340 [Corynebacterium gerontici]